MNFNTEKLEQLVRAEIAEMRFSSFEDSTFCIGKVHGLEVQIRVTRNEDDWIEPEKDTYTCITQQPEQRISE